MMRSRKILLIFLVLLGLLVVTGIIVFVYPGRESCLKYDDDERYEECQRRYQNLRSDQVSIQIEPARVRPGEPFTLSANFKREYDFGNQWWSEVHFIDKTGNELPKQTQAISPSADTLENHSGIISKYLYDHFQERKSAAQFYVEEIGCGIGLGPPEEPPEKYTDRLVLYALPQTPPGEYTVRIDHNTYCNGLPRSPVSLKITILPK